MNAGASSQVAPGLRERVAARFERFLNPVLLKELRQAARGAFLMRSMMFVQFAGLTIAGIMLLSDSARGENSTIGQALFTVAYGCALFALCAVVPFFGFLSFGAERELATLDMLQLTKLRPTAIVSGKLFACALLALEFMATLAPLTMIASLLPGLDPRVVLGAVVALPLFSVALSTIAIGLSGLAQKRLPRAFVSVVLIIFLFICGIYGFAGVSLSITIGRVRGGWSMIAPIAIPILILAMIAYPLYAAACVSLTHREENRSLMPRLSMLATVVLCVAACALIAIFGSTDPSDLAPLVLFALALLAILSMFVVTEAESLPNRVTGTLPKSRLLALLATPFLTGGGRGLLFYLLNAALLLFGAATVVGLANPTVDWSRFLSAPCVAIAYTLVYLGIPSLAFSTTRRDRPRGRLRLWMFVLPIAIFAFVAVFSFMSMSHGGSSWIFESSLNPPYFIGRCLHPNVQNDPTGERYFWLVFASVAVIVNLPRMTRGVHEVLAASAARRADESK